jgi:AraC-like DNA-binding protein
MNVELKNSGYSAYRLREEVFRYGLYNEVQLILRGESRVTIGKETLVLKAPSVHLFSLGKEAAIENFPGLYKVHFQCALHLGSSDMLLGEAPLSAPLVGDPELWWNRSRQAIQAGNVLATKSLLFEVLSLFTKELEAVVERKKQSLEDYEPFLTYVGKVRVEDFSLPKMAKQMGVNPSAFSTGFKNRFGVSAKQFYLSEVMRKAKALLLQKDLRLAEIADTLGFCDAFHLSRTFSKHSGLSPKAFRQQYLSKDKIE